MTYHKSSCVNAKVCVSQAVVQQECFISDYETFGTTYLLFFPWQPQSAQHIHGHKQLLIYFCVLFKARCGSSLLDRRKLLHV